jgi:hypothetical protein
MKATTQRELGEAKHQQPLNNTSVYKLVKASIAFVLMIIAATGWCV